MQRRFEREPKSLQKRLRDLAQRHSFALASPVLGSRGELFAHFPEQRLQLIDGHQNRAFGIVLWRGHRRLSR